MKKLLLASLCFLLLCASQGFAQNRTITGTVTAKEDGLPLPGVTVKVKGTTIGTQTGANGQYTLRVPANATMLDFSFIGYAPLSLPIGNGNAVNAVLTVSSSQLGEVVVTALGINQERRTLGYSAAAVKGETLGKASPTNLLTGLQGKVAGVQISETGSTPGGSTKVIIRGYSSFSQSNQPLYVIDGVPLDNARQTVSNSYDFGNNANDVDPNNVESMTILKGSGATALYGTRGSAGVIIITTKKGKAGKPQVDFASTLQLTDVAQVYKPQSEFGQGWNGTFILSENGNWGPKFDGVMRPWGATGLGTGATIGNQQLIKPFSFIEDNVSNSFDTGMQFNNHLGISGGSENVKYNFSYTNVSDNGILPGNYDKFKRNVFSINSQARIKNLEISGALNYSARTGRVPVTGSGNNTTQGNSFYGSILQIPGDIPIKDLRDYKNLFFNVDNYFTPFAENPYFDLAENGSHFTTNHTFGNLNLTYRLNEWLKLNFQQGADISNTYDKKWSNVSIPAVGSWNDGNNVEFSNRSADVGSVFDESFNNFEYDSKLQALFDRKINNDFSINGLIGVNYNDRADRTLQTYVTDLAIPGFYQINNSVNTPISSETEDHRRTLAFYAQANLGYKNYLFLGLTGRNDITSTLAPGNNSYFYPAVNLSYILTDALNIKSNILSYAKLRASYGRTGSDTSPYRIYNTLSATNIDVTFGNLQFPLNGVAGYTINNQLNTTNLQPESVSETEIGGEFRFFNDRLSLDVAVYQRNRKNQIIPVPLAPGSGYTSVIENFGSSRNRGLELTIGGSPVKSKDFTWDMYYTYSMDRAIVTSLPPEVTIQNLNTFRSVTLDNIEGQPLGLIRGPQPIYVNGHILVGATGLPQQNPDPRTYGSIQPQFHMGFTNSLTYKNFDLGFTIDYQQGGVFYSETGYLLNFVGAAANTVYNDRNAFIIPNSVQLVNGNYVENTTPIVANNYYSYYNISDNPATSYENLILTRTYIKLRQASLGYTLPKSVSNKIHASAAKISVFGTNLYTWLPSSNRIIDPEVTNLGTSLTGEIGENAAGPPLRYFGARLNITF